MALSTAGVWMYVYTTSCGWLAVSCPGSLIVYRPPALIIMSVWRDNDITNSVKSGRKSCPVQLDVCISENPTLTNAVDTAYNACAARGNAWRHAGVFCPVIPNLVSYLVQPRAVGIVDCLNYQVSRGSDVAARSISIYPLPLPHWTKRIFTLIIYSHWKW